MTKELQFSKKYTHEHGEYYYKKHKTGFARRLSNWCEQRMAAAALKIAGYPRVILDFPCGAGRFWQTLVNSGADTLYAADLNEGMIHAAINNQPKEIVSKFTCFQGSAFHIPLQNNIVENVFCMRLIHHFGNSADRIAILKEFARVSSQTICVSLWVDGNLKGMLRKRKEARRVPGSEHNRNLVTRQDFATEIQAAGLTIVGKVDFLKFHSMWSVYILRKN